MRLLIAALTWIIVTTVSIPAVAAAIGVLSMLAGAVSKSNGHGLPEPSILIAASR